MIEHQNWKNFKHAAEHLNYATIILTIRAGIPQTYNVVGKKIIINPPSVKAKSLSGSGITEGKK